MIPLFPVKKLFSLLGLDAMGSTLPDGIVVESIHFFDEHDKLKVDDLLDAIGWMGIDLPSEVNGRHPRGGRPGRQFTRTL